MKISTRLLAAIVALAVTGALLSRPSVAPALEVHNCGTVAGSVALYELESTITCKRARDVGKRWLHKVIDRQCSRMSCRANGFLCRAKPPARVYYTVRCIRGEDRVSWQISVD